MHSNIRKRLSSAEGDILLALSGENGDVNSFEKNWSTLQHEFESTASTNDITSDTTFLAHAVASRVALIASCFLDLEQAGTELKGKLRTDFDAILGNLEGTNLSSLPQELPVGDHAGMVHSPTPPHEFSRSFIAETYPWLLDNVANPYPSAEFKASVARRHNCSISSVNAWFISSRRRMGWTALCREHFHNCRADAVGAAYRALVKEDTDRKLPPEIIQAFVTVKSNAEALYSSTYISSPLAGELDAIVKDMTDGSLEKERRGGKYQTSQDMSSQEYGAKYNVTGKSLDTNFLYPTPCHSPSISPVPAVPLLEESLGNESEDEAEDISPPCFAGHKRRGFQLDTFGCDHVGSTTRPAKRSRIANYVSDLDSIPSPPPSPTRLLSSSGLSSHEASQVIFTSPQLQPSRPRKRRLSDSASQHSLGRPVGINPGPRMHAVSDPLPGLPCNVDLDVDDWFNTTFAGCFDVPPPIDSSNIDPSALLEVELFGDYSIPQPLPRSWMKDVSSLYSDGDPQTTSLDPFTLSTHDFSNIPGSFLPGDFVDGADPQYISPAFAEEVLVPLSMGVNNFQRLDNLYSM